ncbi:MAG: NADH-quinone oxidoreductase subunit J [Sorangium cellulosum]|nr:MAG: NADH-quinone oxidoreductase subunit J [Sorangium cellulosum]
MTTVVEQGLYYLSAVLAIAGALGTVGSKSAIRAAMSLLVTILGIAGLYITLSAQLLAAIQVMVYAGAVVVLFVFVIMLLGGQGEPKRDSSSFKIRAAAAGMFGVASIMTVLLVMRVGIGGPHIFDPPHAEFGSVAALGKVMFTDGIVAFELVGVLLTAAIVGVMAVARTRAAKPSAALKDKKEVAS